MSIKIIAPLPMALIFIVALSGQPAVELPPRLLTGHERGVTGLDFSPDGKMLASVGADRNIILWDPATGKEIRKLNGVQPFLGVAANPSYRILGACDAEVISLWDVRPSEGKLMGVIRGHAGPVRSIAYNPDGKVLASAGEDMTVRLWDAAKGKELTVLKGHTGRVNAVAFPVVVPEKTPRMLASASDDGTVRVWDQEAGKELHVLKGHTGPVLCLAFSPTGDRLASGGLDRTVRIWEKGKLIITYTGHSAGVYALAHGLDNRTLVSGSADKTVRVWDSFFGRDGARAIDCLSGFKDTVTAVAVAPDGKTLAAGDLAHQIHLFPLQPLPRLTAEKVKAANTLQEALALQKQEKYAEALAIFEKGLAQSSEVFGAHHALTSAFLGSISNCYALMGQPAKAIEFRMREIAVIERFPERRDELISSMILLANAHKELGQFELAIAPAQRALQLSTELRGADDPKTAQNGYYLGTIYVALGRLAEAEKLFRHALQINEVKLGEHERTAVVLNALAFVHASRGHYDLAEPLFTRSLAMLEKKLGGLNPQVASVLTNLGVFYSGQGQLDKAEPILQRALQIMEKLTGQNDPSTALFLNNLVYVYLARGEWAKAEPLLIRCVRLLEIPYGKDHVQVAVGLLNLAHLYLESGNYAAAEPHLLRALKIWQTNLGPKHMAVAVAASNLAVLYSRLGKFDKALTLIEDCVQIAQDQFGEVNPQLALFLTNQALILGAAGRQTEAVKYVERARRIYRAYLAQRLPYLPEAEQLKFLGQPEFADSIHSALSLAYWNAKNDVLVAQSVAWLLNAKAVTQEALAQRALMDRDSTDPQRGEEVRKLLELRRQLASVSLQSPPAGQEAAYRKQVEDLTAREADLVKKLGQQEGPQKREGPWVELAQVRQAIPKDAVLVEIVRLRPYDFKEKDPKKGWQKPRYVAWVIPPSGGGEIKLVDLGDAEGIEESVALARRALQTPPGAQEALRERQLQEPLGDLAKRILQPLLPYIGQSERWIISPDAGLWLVPWAALPLGKGQFVVEKHVISQVITGRDLVAESGAASKARPLIMADPDYDLGADAVLAKAKQLGLQPVQPGIRSGQLTNRWSRLPGTAAEAKAITPRLAGHTQSQPIIRLGAEALEGVVKEVKRPSVLVLSTHGFFLDDQEGILLQPLASAPRRGLDIIDAAPARPLVKRPNGKDAQALENPLVRCGLVFAGANQRSQLAAAGGDDGILTGLEIAGIDLRGTQLVVLSACETGLGHIRNGEGVAGLRQAFQLAGARAVVSSLWHIPDQETANLMEQFFTSLEQSKGTPADALRAAQRAVIQERRKKQGAAHPFYWAAFTVTGP